MVHKNVIYKSTISSINFKKYTTHEKFNSGEKGLIVNVNATGKRNSFLDTNEVGPVVSTSIKIKPKTDIPADKKVFHLYCPGLTLNQNENSTVPFYLTNIGNTEVISPGELFYS